VPHAGSGPRTEAIYVISGGWHTELGLPLETLSGSLAALKSDFPKARYLVFGWGARDYYMAKNPGMGDLLSKVRAFILYLVTLRSPLALRPSAFNV
jgi:Protein of unknown function (DUF2459)